MPPFTIIIATHQRPSFLGRALASVKAQGEQIAQTIVVSDAPSVESYAIATPYLTDDDLFMQRSGTPGPSESRNLGIHYAKGGHVIFLDDDDALSPTFLKEAMNFLKDDAVIYTDFYHVVERIEGHQSVPLHGERRSLANVPPEQLFIKNFIPSACVIYPRALVQERVFHPTVGYEDWDFILNVASVAELLHVPVDGPIIYARETSDNRGSANESRLEGIYRQVYKRWPAPSATSKLARQAFLASAGLAAQLEDL
jgi:glycosyltransferase involved in cell wall biosynthesis